MNERCKEKQPWMQQMCCRERRLVLANHIRHEYDGHEREYGDPYAPGKPKPG